MDISSKNRSYEAFFLLCAVKETLKHNSDTKNDKPIETC